MGEAFLTLLKFQVFVDHVPHVVFLEHAQVHLLDPAHLFLPGCLEHYLAFFEGFLLAELALLALFEGAAVIADDVEGRREGGLKGGLQCLALLSHSNKIIRE